MLLLQVGSSFQLGDENTYLTVPKVNAHTGGKDEADN